MNGKNNRVSYSHNKELQQKLYEYRKDSTMVDQKMLMEDLVNKEEDYSYPLEFGAFPTPKYNSFGNNSFKGLGYFVQKNKIFDKDVLTLAFYFNNNSVYKPMIGDKGNYVFLKLVIVLDKSTLLDNLVYPTMVSSRNHPNYIGQGRCSTDIFNIDYLAFITPTMDSYAIVNMRLFDLQLGNTVVVYPKANGSLESAQFSSSQNITFDKLEEYFNNFESIHPEVKNFLNN